MTMNFTNKEFVFHDSRDIQETKVIIAEIADADYGLYVWPCAPVLAQYIWLKRSFLVNKSVLEIGAGTALPGIVAAKCKADVILSDSSHFENCLDLCKRNSELNGVPEITVVGITWGLVTPTLTSLPKLDVILASDCFYDSKDFEDVLVTLSYLLHQNPQSEVWCAYQVRSCDRSIEHLIIKYNLIADELPLPYMDDVTMSHSCHTNPVIQLFRLKLK